MAKEEACVLGFWWLVMVTMQVGFVFGAANLSQCRGGGLPEYPTYLLAIGGVVALAAAGFELQLADLDSCWVFIRALFTIANVLDVATDSLGYGQVVASTSCGDDSLEQAWQQALEQSDFAINMPLNDLAMWAWILSGVQFVIAFLMLLVIFFSDEEVNSDEEETEVPMFVGDLLGLDCLAGDLNTKEGGNEEDVSMIRSILKLVFRLLCETLPQLHLQISTLSLSLSLEGWNQGAWQTLASVAFSLALVVLKPKELFTVVLFIGERVQKIPTDYNCCGVFGFLLLIIFIIGVVFLEVVACIKFVAIFGCPQHVWNLNGCVEISV
mmetsp:Transcript_78536/g.179711  ORF Transcript_78536/g.179711 Transcript_78536/m.179711 type:complete len:325 (+) Transcript_78536:30-1004(+)